MIYFRRVLETEWQSLSAQVQQLRADLATAETRLAEATALLDRVRETIDRVMAQEDEESGAVGLAEELDGIVPARAPVQPAAPEPSADPIHAILNQRCRGKSLHPEMVALRSRAESAEAQLTAVRMVVSRLRSGRGPVDREIAIELLERAILGSGGETGSGE